MDYTEDALVLRTVNFGENDRMVTLLTAGRGKISAAMKGVRKAAARLNFAAQPFCFAEYTIAERAGRRTVTGASLYDGFYALREDMTKYYTAICVAEACDALVLEEMRAGEFLVAAVSALREVCAGEEYALIRFLCSALRYAGYPIEIPKGEVKRFGFTSGSFSAELEEEGVPVSESTVETLRFVLSGEGTPTADGKKRALRLLRAFFSYQTESDLPTLGELLNLME